MKGSVATNGTLACSCPACSWYLYHCTQYKEVSRPCIILTQCQKPWWSTLGGEGGCGWKLLCLLFLYPHRWKFHEQKHIHSPAYCQRGFSHRNHNNKEVQTYLLDNRRLQHYTQFLTQFQTLWFFVKSSSPWKISSISLLHLQLPQCEGILSNRVPFP